MHQDKVLCLQSMKICKFKEIIVSNLVMSKETVVTEGYELAMNVFQLSGVSRRYTVPHNCGIR